MLARKKIINMNVDVLNMDEAVRVISGWAAEMKARYVCVSNVHMCMEVYDDESYNKVVNGADLTVPDGMPLVWAQKIMGGAAPQAGRVRGPDLMWELCRCASSSGLKIGLYGGTESAVVKLKKNLQNAMPGLNIVFAVSPPFRALTVEEDDEYVKQINNTGVEILFVGLGCPKQERWMFEKKNKLSCVMVGVGAAFDFIAGEKKIAPIWMQQAGLEWLFRLATEPKRLWKRYAKHNSRFIILFLYQYIRCNLLRLPDPF